MVTALELVIKALADATGLPTVSRVPTRNKDVFIRVEQAAPEAYSPSHDKVLLIVQVYGILEKYDEVINTIGLVRDYLRFQLPTDVPNIVGWHEVSGPYEFPDPVIEETHTRWQLSGQAFHTLT